LHFCVLVTQLDVINTSDNKSDSLSQMFNFQHAINAVHVDYISLVTRPITALLTVITLLSQCTIGQFGQHCRVNFKENSLLQTVFGLVSLWGSEITTDRKYLFNVRLTS